jgi:hypothetical protein
MVATNKPTILLWMHSPVRCDFALLGQLNHVNRRSVAADSLEEAGDRLFTFARLPPSQWRSLRTTNGNRHELPRLRGSAGACVADRHPVLASGLDGRWNIGVGVAQKVHS